MIPNRKPEGKGRARRYWGAAKREDYLTRKGSILKDLERGKIREAYDMLVKLKEVQ